MKIIAAKELAGMPAGTVFCMPDEDDPVGYANDLKIKGESHEYPDGSGTWFAKTDLLPQPLSDREDTAEERESGGRVLKIRTWTNGYSGTVFPCDWTGPIYVFEQTDLELLIGVLVKSLELTGGNK